jgi:hypothetical protein
MKRAVIEAKDAQNYLATTCAGAMSDRSALQQQQTYHSQPMIDPAYGWNGLCNQYAPHRSPLIPHLLAELGYGAPPLPSYRPTLFKQAVEQWQVPEVTAQSYTAMNKHRKPVVMPKKATKGAQTTAAAGTAAAQESDDMHASGRTVVATKINHLGFGAMKALKSHFAQYGKIDHVCVPQKIKDAYNGQGQLRPSGLGFIVMKTEEDAQAILEAGAEHTVCGKVINLRAFKEGRKECTEAIQEDGPVVG